MAAESHRSPYLISVVLPVYNEAGNLVALHREIQEALTTAGYAPKNRHIIYVDDGSSDGTAKILSTLSEAIVVTLRRRYGQASALDAGFQAALAELTAEGLVVSLDADGQNDPADIPALIAHLQETGDDVVVGWRVERRDTIGVRFYSVIGRWSRHFLVNDVVNDAGCTLRVYRRPAIEALALSGDMHRWIVPILRWKGFQISELPVNHRPRRTGSSKYGPGKAVVGFFDLLYVWFICKHADRPIHFFGWFSFGSFFIGIVSGIWAIEQKFGSHVNFNRDGWFFLAIFFLLSSILFFSAGLMLDFLIRSQPDPVVRQKSYLVKSIAKNP